MKKTFLLAAISAVALLGCRTTDTILEATKTAAEAGPAIVEDAQALSKKTESLWDKLTGLFKKDEAVPAPTASAK